MNLFTAINDGMRVALQTDDTAVSPLVGNRLKICALIRRSQLEQAFFLQLDMQYGYMS